MDVVKKISVFVLAMLMLCSVTVTAYELPQKYSSDSYLTEIPEVNVPAEPAVQTEILTYFNRDLVPLTNPAKKQGNTVYIPVREFFLRLGFTVEEGRTIKISGSNVTAELKKGKRNITVNGKTVSLTSPVKKIGGVTMAPAGVAAEVLNAKVWYDELSKTLVVSDASHRSDDILRAINYKFWMNGEPYYEISFNKFDLCYQIAAKYTKDAGYRGEENQIAGAEDALKILHENGFRSIRAFVHCNLRGSFVKGKETSSAYYLETMDTLFDLLDKYEIQCVICMQLPSSDFCAKGEDFFDLICNRDSESRKIMYEFIDFYVGRYKDRKSVFMWEIVNEGNLECDIGWQVKDNRYSLYQLGQFYADCAERIHMNDPERLVTGGDACLRPSQWHQYLGVKEGAIGVNWTKDTLEDRLKAYTMLYYGLDVVSGHCYNTGNTGTEYAVSDTDATKVNESFDLLMKESRRIGKIFYNGETAVQCEEYSDEEWLEPSKAFIQAMIDSGVQVNHWWTFHTNDSYHAPKIGWQVTEGALFEAIKDGNKRIKEKYVVNFISAENTNNAWTDAPDTLVAAAVTDIDTSELAKGCNASYSFTGFAVAFAACFCAILLKKRSTAKD